MSYSVKELSKISGVTVRTLHWYDKIGLLVALRNEANGYRVYTNEELDRLQDILYFRQLGLNLVEISEILSAKANCREQMLIEYKEKLLQKQAQIVRLLNSVNQTISTIKGDKTMSAQEKFEAFKEDLIEKNEQNYGVEMREKHGNDAINSSNELLRQMGEERYNQMQALSEEINMLLRAAVADNEQPQSEKCVEIVKKHREWLSYTWKNYSAQAHKGLAQGYVSDERFTKYYEDAAGKGAAELLCDAICANV